MGAGKLARLTLAGIVLFIGKIGCHQFAVSCLIHQHFHVMLDKLDNLVIAVALRVAADDHGSFRQLRAV